MSKIEKITQQEKNDFKKLLEDMALSIKNKEKLSNKTTEVDEKILSLAGKIDSLQTQQEAKNLLNEVQKELSVLKEYSEFKKILIELEKKVDKFKETHLKNVKTKLTNLQKDIFDKNNLTPDQLLSKAEEGRKKSAKKIEHLLDKLAQKGGLIGKIAKKANS